MQDGIRLFTSDEAFMSADWVGNAYIIYAFHTRKNEFLFFNRAYPELRKRYRAALTAELTAGQDVNPSFFKSENTLTAERAWRHWQKVVDGARDGKLLPGAVTEIATVVSTGLKTQDCADSYPENRNSWPTPKNFQVALTSIFHWVEIQD